MHNTSNISVVILVKNAQETIFECLDALRTFNEIILLDNLSSDETLQIAKQFDNVKIFQSDFIGFGALKNLAISYAQNDWILNIDSDEILEEEAIKQINTLKLDTHCIYALSRKNYYDGEWIKACGWYPDFVNRLFNKTHTHFNNKEVHESLIISNHTKIIHLQASLKHYTTKQISQMLNKMNSYTSLDAQENSTKKVSMSMAILRFFWVFFKDYFLRSGWRYGYKGFIIAWINANGSFFKYAKKYEKTKKAQCNEN